MAMESEAVPNRVGEKEEAEEPTAGGRDTGLMTQLRRTVKILLEIARIPSRATYEEEKFLGASHDAGEIETTTRKYPVYRQSQVAYAVTRALRETVDPLFCEFSGQFRRSASFEEVQIARDKHERCFVDGYCYFGYVMPEPEDGPHDPTPVPLILSASLTGWACHVRFYSKVGDLGAVAAFLKEIDIILAEKNYLKGEKLELRGRGQLGFFAYEDLGWDDIILTPEVRAEIQRQLIFPIANEEVYKNLNLPWKRGVLLIGIPGTGKTYLGKIICHNVQCTFIWVTVKALSDIDDVRKLYEAARELSPTLVFWEDIDLIGADRRGGYFSPILGELLNQLDGMSPLDGVFTVATTNYVEHLDRALAQRPARFDIRLTLELPNLTLREKMFGIFLVGHKVSGKIDFTELAKASVGMSGAAIVEAVIRAVQISLENEAKGTIDQRDLMWGIKRVKIFGQKQLGFLPGGKKEEEAAGGVDGGKNIGGPSG